MAKQQGFPTSVLTSNLAFLPTRNALALWWSNFWRSMCIAAMLMLPIAVFYFLLGAVYMMLFAMLSFPFPWLALSLSVFAVVLPVILNNVVFPILAQAFAVRWMSRKGQLRTYTFTATYNGQPATTFRVALRFAAWTYLELFKYVWPIFLVGGLLGAAPEVVPTPDTFLTIVGYTMIPLAIYLHLLALSDLLRRGTYSKKRCTLAFTKNVVKSV